MNIATLKRFKHGATIAYATTIEWNGDKTKCGIYHHNSLIAVIDESGATGHKRVVSVSNAGYHTRTTSQRVGAVLQANTLGYYNTRIIQGIMHLTCTQSHYTGGGVYDVFNGHRFISIIVNDNKEFGELVGNVITDESLYNGIH
jgi:hypothetical protein